MKKVITLNESDITNIIKRIVNESYRYKLPDGITIELINKYLNEENPSVLNSIYLNNVGHEVVKKLIKSIYIDGKPLNQVVKEFHDLAKNGELFDNKWKNIDWSNYTESLVNKTRKRFLESLKRWGKYPGDEVAKELIKREEISQLKQSLYKLLSQYGSKLTSDELNDILIDVRLNKNPGSEKFDDDQRLVMNRYKNRNYYN